MRASCKGGLANTQQRLNIKGDKKMNEYNGKPIKIIDRFSNNRWVDYEHIANDKTKFACVLYKYRGKWYFKKMNGDGPVLINKENIKEIKTDMLKKGDIIKYKYENFFYKVINVNKNAENPFFKYELEALNGNKSHSYFMGDKDIGLITIIKEG